MPTNVVKTPEDEKKWQAAKAQAKKQGKGDNHAYIMAIYKSMKGEKKAMYSEIAQSLLGEPMTKSAKLIARGRQLDPNFDEMLKEAVKMTKESGLAGRIAKALLHKRKAHAYIARSGKLKRFFKNFIDMQKLKKQAPGLYDLLKAKELAVKNTRKNLLKNYKSVANYQERLLERALRAETEAFRAKSVPFAATHLDPTKVFI